VKPTTLIFHFATLEEKESRDLGDPKPAGKSSTFVHIYLRDLPILALFFRDRATMLESPDHSIPLFDSLSADFQESNLALLASIARSAKLFPPERIIHLSCSRVTLDRRV
jgi:hypothetical protein